MKFLELEIFNDFKCIGSACPFTCCSGGWRIIVDSETDSYYMTVEGAFGDRLKKNITSEDDTRCFALSENGRCPFLNDENLCDIYINLGEEHMCYTCKTYPRYSFLAGDILFEGVSISCPEVAKFFLSHREPLKIDFAESSKGVSMRSETDWNIFNHAIRAFTTAVAISQDREFTIAERLILLILFVFQFQTYLGDERDPSGLIELFYDHSNFIQILPQTGIYQRDIGSKAEFMAEYISVFRKVKRLDTSLPELNDLISYFGSEGQLPAMDSRWRECYIDFDVANAQIWQEQLVVYILFRYFMQGLKDKDFYIKMVRGLILLYELILFTMVLHHLRFGRMPEFQELVMIVAHSSRLVEHSSGFGDKIMKHFEDKGITNPSYLFRLFS